MGGGPQIQTPKRTIKETKEEKKGIVVKIGERNKKIREETEKEETEKKSIKKIIRIFEKPAEEREKEKLVLERKRKMKAKELEWNKQRQKDEKKEMVEKRDPKLAKVEVKSLISNLKMFGLERNVELGCNNNGVELGCNNGKKRKLTGSLMDPADSFYRRPTGGSDITDKAAEGQLSYQIWIMEPDRPHKMDGR